METISAVKNYTVMAGSGILGKLPKLVKLDTYSGIVIITDKTVWKHCAKFLQFAQINPLKIEVEAGEQSKNINTAQKIWKKMLREGCDRKTLVINVGGGSILDLGGFVASLFMRGVDFLHVPTTLLAQVDASIGAKVAVNFAGIKNLIGNFSQPIGVISDTQVLSSLENREWVAGFAEIIKHGLIGSRDYFVFVTGRRPGEFTKQELIKIIIGSIRIKAGIINQDEKERGVRKLLNFGHTLGHAIESVSLETNSPLLHGEAISIGMTLEAKISHLLGKITRTDLQLIEQSLTKAGLPVKLPKHLNKAQILQKIKSDKKNAAGVIQWTLLDSIGKALYEQTVPSEILGRVLS